MSTSRVLVPAVLLLSAAMVVAAQLSLGLIRLPFSPSVQTGPAPAESQRNAAVSSPDAKPDVPKPKPPSDFDVARIDPDGASVFAGRAAPKSWVTVHADGVPVGTVETDGNGEWSMVVTDQKLAPSPKLTVTTSGEPPPRPAKIDSASQKPESQARDAGAVGREIVGRLEAMVATARASAEAGRAPGPQQQVAASNPTPDAHAVAVAPSRIETTALPAPFPIMFHYREATFTEEGRKAAELLREYVRLRGLGSLTLTGHADERGSVEANMELSRERLETVSRFLREGGYAGALDLVPKGKSEPYTGVDRSKYPREVLYQLDRRVELGVRR